MLVQATKARTQIQDKFVFTALGNFTQLLKSKAHPVVGTRHTGQPLSNPHCVHGFHNSYTGLETVFKTVLQVP